MILLPKFVDTEEIQKHSGYWKDENLVINYFTFCFIHHCPVFQLAWVYAHFWYPDTVRDWEAECGTGILNLGTIIFSNRSLVQWTLWNHMYHHVCICVYKHVRIWSNPWVLSDSQSGPWLKGKNHLSTCLIGKHGGARRSACLERARKLHAAPTHIKRSLVQLFHLPPPEWCPL